MAVTKSFFYFILAILTLVGRAPGRSELVRAARISAAAGNAFEVAFDLLDGHALDNAADRLQIAVLSAEKGYVMYYIVL